MTAMEPIHADLDEFDNRQSCRHGYRALFAGVLLVAINDALGLSRCAGDNKKTLKRRALNWINSPDVGPGSCRWYCDWLDIDASALRADINQRCGLPADIYAATVALERAA